MNKQIFISIVVSLYVLLIFTPVYAGTYYVSNNGVASWTQAQSIHAPCSAQTAMQNAKAGDTVYFRGGVYTVNQAAPYHAALEPTNSGIEGMPIVFAAYSSERPIVNVILRGESHYGIGTGGRDWIIWDGFEVYGNGGTHMGGCMVGGESASTNLIIRNCTFHGGGHEITHTDNAELLRIEKTSHATIQNCLMYNARQVNGWHNTSAIKAYSNTSLIIENTDIYNTTNAIYLKSNNPGAIVRNNWIHDNGYGIYVAVFDPYSTDNCQFYNNVIANSERTSIYVEASGSATANNYKFYNNTIYAPNNTGVSYANGSGWDIYNNIIVWNGSGSHALWIYKDSSLNNCDHNQWGANAFSISVVEQNYATYRSLSAWKTSNALAGGSNPGTGDLTSDNNFVNLTGQMKKLSDFAIKSTSPCVGAGRNFTNIGANIDSVGVDTESNPIDNTPPSPPIGVGVNVNL